MLPVEERAALERRIQQMCERADHGAATREVLAGYGGEIMGFLVAATRDEALASDAFSLFCEHMWKGLPKFAWRSSLRTWSYVVARNALRMTLRSSARRGDWVPLSDAGAADIAEQIRSSTRQYLRTETKDAVAGLRSELDPEDQQILILRIGRGMSWLDIAQVLHEGESPEPDVVKREAARLRQRYARAKAKLEALVRERGLVDES